MRPIHHDSYKLPVLAVALAMLAAIPPASAMGLTPSSSPASPGASSTTGSRTAAAGTHTVTLLTGDRVTVTANGGPESVTVTGPGGHRANARITRQNGDVFVFPSAADPYVAAGTLDQELFNVTRLIADGYDDAHTDGLPLIASYGSSANSSARLSAAARVLPEGTRNVRALTSIDSAALVEDRASAAGFWSALTAPAATLRSAAPATGALSGGVRKLWLDGKVHADLAESTAQIGAPQVWKDGNTGQGVDVAVLDTGYDTGHPDLATAVKSSVSFVPDEDIVDRVGHGTHVASTIAGSGAASNGLERGVAPDAQLHVGKVLDDMGSGQESWIISGMQWAARDAKARVISMSLGSDRASDGTDPMSQAVDELSQETGALFTIAAGNSGPGDHTVASPGAATDALTVGAVDSGDTVADFSSRGPRYRDDAPKPEITAPGVDILAARSQYSPYSGDLYTTLSGTSMATPHVAGAAALVAAAHPDWTGSQIKDALISSAVPTPDAGVDAGGNGRVDAHAAAEGTLFATGTADAGIHTGGGAPGEVVDRTVTWTNTAAAAVTVSLTVDAPGAPAGAFTVRDGQLTVPAGGTASTVVTTHLDPVGAGKRVGGQLVASVGGAASTRTLLTVSTREEDRHLRVHLANSGGYPVSVLVMYQRQGDEYYSTGYSDPDGLLDTVVPPGTYTVWSWMAVPGVHGASSAGLALLSAPTVTVGTHSDADVTLDATKVRQTRLTTPKPSTDSDLRMDFSRSYDDGSPPATDTFTLGDGFDSLWALPVSKPASGEALYTARWRMQQPLVSMASGTQNFDDLWVQPGSALQPTGDREVPTIFAGNGTTEDYAGLDARGKIAVVRYAPDDDEEDLAGATGSARASATAPDQVAAAQNAGVALLVLVNDLNGRLYEPVRKTSLTVVGVSRTEGEALIDRIQHSADGSVSMHLVTHATTGYLYDLVRTWRDGIPSDQSYAPTEHQLARVDVDFRNDPATEVDEFRFDIEPYLGFKVGGTRLSHAGAHRTDWVTSDRKVPWMEEATAGITSFQYSDLIHYPAGRATAVNWFGPFDRPRLNGSQYLPRRTADGFDVAVPAWGDGVENHAGAIGPGETSQWIGLYRGNTLVSGGDGSYVGTADVPAGEATYRLVTTTQRTGYPLSTATDTEWGFASAAPGADQATTLPLLQVDYGIATTDNGTATRDARFTVTSSALPGTTASHVRTDWVDVSYDDGKTWHRASQGATVRLSAPSRATFLSLRVHASDAQGDTVTQTITRAVRLG